jgi:hypothetical protein
MTHRRVVLTALLGAGLLLCLGHASPAQEGWKPAAAPLLTRFAKDVSPARSRPDYPRPLFERKEWKSLNGLWEFAFDDRNEGRSGGWSTGKILSERILVPFTYEAALSGIGKGKEVHERVWYRRTFDVPRSWSGKRTMLRFNASDCETTVWVNGREVGSHRGGYEPFSFDITEALKADAVQEVVVGIYDPADPRGAGFQPKGKQLGSEGIWYTRTTGIWQSVWLEPLASGALDQLQVDSDVDPGTRAGKVGVTYSPVGEAPQEVEISVRRDGKTLVRKRFQAGSGRATASVEVAGCDLWSPESPALYDLTLRAYRGGKEVDEAKSYCAFRRYEIRNGRLTLNGKPYFLRGVLDQGYWPDGILTPPTDAAIRADVEMTKRLGFNMARKHVKVEDPRWYYWCDHLGLAVWQDMPSSHNLSTAAARENFRNELSGAIATTRSYPCVLHWIPFNENWGNPGAFQDEMVKLVRTLDASRPITDASGWTQRSFTDVVDAHDYSNNLIRQGVENPVQPKVVGEYGGIALPVEGHTWTTGWGYQNARTPEALVRRIHSQTAQLFQARNLSGFVYTQLTDVEQELNGLMTYDRLPKTDPAKLAEVFEGRLAPIPPPAFLREWLVAGPFKADTDLRTATDNAATQRQLQQILDHAFLPNEANLDPVAGETWRKVTLNEDALDFHRVFGRETQNAAAYAVAVFTVPQEVRNATFFFGSDDGARVWLNGKQVWNVNRVRGVNLDEDSVPGLELKAGRNVLVVKVAQGIGGWGLAARFEAADGTPIKSGS